MWYAAWFLIGAVIGALGSRWNATRLIIYGYLLMGRLKKENDELRASNNQLRIWMNETRPLLEAARAALNES